jgi:NitT/TauT family transport system permease protein
VAIGLWFLLVKVSKTNVFPSPARSTGMAELAGSGVLWHYVLDSLRRVVSGYGVALCPRRDCGARAGWYPRLSSAFNPVIQMCRPISPLAWMPPRDPVVRGLEWALA